MKERPILFSAPMVRAILEGRKTQTRRAIRKQFAADAEPAEVPATSPEGWQISGHSGLWWDDTGACIDDAIRCPYGMPGDRLWVRETWAPEQIDADAMTMQEVSDSVRMPAYRADFAGNPAYKWRPSIHMPRWASRILLEITAVRVERLQDISQDDAKAEGVEQMGACPGLRLYRNYLDPMTGYIRPDDAFLSLWNSINGARSWDANPWVWVVEFKRVAA